MRIVQLLDTVIPGRPEGPGPESIPTAAEYGFRARDFVAPRNDEPSYLNMSWKIVDQRLLLASISSGV
jgi:hypothetical protein